MTTAEMIVTVMHAVGQEEMLRKGLAMYGPDPCRIARLIGGSTPCLKVDLALLSFMQGHARRDHQAFPGIRLKRVEPGVLAIRVAASPRL